MCAVLFAGESSANGPTSQITGNVVGLEAGQSVTLRNNGINRRINVPRDVIDYPPPGFSFSVPTG